MRAVFPSSVISIADYDKSGVQFCVDNFNCVDGNGSIPQNTFDLVFLSSVFTHLPAKIVEPLLERLLQSLNHNGVLIFTTQGRYSIERIKGFDWANEKGREWMHYNLGKDTFAEVAHLYEETGYGYVNYPNQTDYGVCIAKPSWYSNIALRRDDVIQILFQEKGSDNHQDVSAFMRANLTDHSKGPLW
jgi:SAM-dependent methyltransferase